MPRQLRSALRSATLLFALAVAACGGGDGSPGSTDEEPRVPDGNLDELSISTQVTPASGKVGDAVTVRCRAENDAGEEVGVGFRRRIEPASAGSFDDRTLTLDEPGEHEVACGVEADGETRWDPDPVIVRVSTETGVVAVETSVDPAEVDAGDSAEVTCEAIDDEGQPVDEATVVQVSPDMGIEVDGTTVTPTSAQTYEVACALANRDLADDSPAQLVVSAGAPARTTASVDPGSVAAGETAEVTCTVEDEWGNVVETADPTVEADDAEAVEVDGRTVTGREAGTWMLTCAADGVPSDAREPAELDVAPGAPDSLELTVEPDQPVYQPGAEVTLTPEVYDAFDNVVPDADVTVSAPDAGVSATGELAWTLEGDGEHVFTAEVEGTDLSAERTLLVDGTAPELVIEQPERGATLDGQTDVTVTGEVHDDASGVEELTVNDEATTPQDDGSFTRAMTAGHGLNAVLAEAVDAAGHQARATAAYYHSTEWQPYTPDEPEESRLTDAVRLWLDEETIDDGDHSTDPPDDLATFVETALRDLDLSALIDGPVWSQTAEDVVSQQVTVSGITVDLTGDAVLEATATSIDVDDEATVSLDPRDGGLLVDGTVDPSGADPAVRVMLDVTVDLPLTASATVQGISGSAELEPTATLTAEVTVDELTYDADLDVAKQPGQALSVSVADLQVDTKGIAIAPTESVTVDLGSVDLPIVGSVNLPDADLTTLVGGVGDLLSDTLLNPIANTLDDVASDFLLPLFQGQIANLIEDFLKSLTIDREVTLPEALGGDDAITLALDAVLGSVSFSEAGVAVGMDAVATGDLAMEAEVLGSIRRAGCNGNHSEPFAFPKTEPVEVGLHADVLNQFLHAAWRAAAFDLQVSEELLGELDAGPEGLELAELQVEPSFRLPPILDDCNDKQVTVAQAGDVRIEASFELEGTPVELTAWASFAGQVVFQAQQNTVGLEVGQTKLQSLELTQVDGELPVGEAQLRQVLSQELLPDLIGALTDEVLGSFPLPTLSLSELSSELDADVTLELGGLELLQDNGVIGVTGAFQ